jgi:hypothetical protein
MGATGVMTVEIVDYDRPRRLLTSIRSSYLDVDGTLTFDQADGGTRMRWSWDMRLRGAMRVLSPVVRAIGPRWEHRNWAGLSSSWKAGGQRKPGDLQLTAVPPARPGRARPDRSRHVRSENEISPRRQAGAGHEILRSLMG